MTLVLQCTIQSMPVLLGDVLLSRRNSSPIAGLPTLADTSALFTQISPEVYVPFNVCQKLVIINSNLAIGWAGERGAASDVIGSFRARDAKSPLTVETFFDFIQQFSSETWDKVHLAVNFFENGVDYRYQTANTSICEMEPYGTISILGSGTEQAIETLKLMRGARRDSMSSPTEYDFALEFQCSLMGVFLISEGTSSQPLSQLFGGGYEMILGSLKRGFHKIDDVTHVFWFIEREGNNINPIAGPRRVTRYKYFGDLLVVRSVAFNEEGTEYGEDKLLVVPPVDWSADLPEQIPIPPFNADTWCHHFVVFRPDKTVIGFMSQLQVKVAASERWFWLEERTGSRHVYMTREFLNQILDKANSMPS